MSQSQVRKTVDIDPVTELTRFLQDQLALRDVIQKDHAHMIYQKCIALHQSAVSRRGKALETHVANLFQEKQIPFMPQACVNRDGIIVPPTKGLHRHDFVIDAQMGDCIHEKIVVSCKTSLRERYLQDANVQCKTLYMVTMDPSALRKTDTFLTEHKIHLIYIPKDGNKGTKSTEISYMLEQILATKSI